jgi:hypothetical protein
MKTLICLHSKGNEVITLCLFNLYDRVFFFFLRSHHCCMCYRCWCSLQHSCISRVRNDNVHQGLKVVFNGKDIHLSLNVMREKVGNFFLNICFTIHNNNCDNILKYINTSMEVNVVWKYYVWCETFYMCIIHQQRENISMLAVVIRWKAQMWTKGNNSFSNWSSCFILNSNKMSMKSPCQETWKK